MWCWQSIVIYAIAATNGVTSSHPGAATGSTAPLYRWSLSEGAAGAAGPVFRLAIV